MVIWPVAPWITSHRTVIVYYFAILRIWQYMVIDDVAAGSIHMMWEQSSYLYPGVQVRHFENRNQLKNTAMQFGVIVHGL